MDMCLRSEFSETACNNAKSVLAGRAMDSSLASPICAALLSTASQTAPSAKAEVEALGVSLVESAGAMHQRSAQGLAGFAALDKAVAQKKGLPRAEDYLVKAAHPINGPQLYNHGGDNSFPPVASVDQTIQLPPDSDGDYYNTPRDGWTENKKPPAAAPT